MFIARSRNGVCPTYLTNLFLMCSVSLKACGHDGCHSALIWVSDLSVEVFLETEPLLVETTLLLCKLVISIAPPLAVLWTTYVYLLARKLQCVLMGRHVTLTFLREDRRRQMKDKKTHDHTSDDPGEEGKPHLRGIQIGAMQNRNMKINELFPDCS